MPRHLVENPDWRPLKIQRKDAKCGDLLFVRNKKHPKLLSHAALILGVDQIFHCSPFLGTATIQTDAEFFSSYEQKLNFNKMIRYIDPRNAKLRKENKGIYISNTGS